MMAGSEDNFSKMGTSIGEEENQLSKAELMVSGINSNGKDGGLTSTMPDRFLSLFRPEEMLDIGDEVTVPSSPFPFANYSDHSYVSSSRLETPTPRFSDCVSESSLSEFHDLFHDLTSDYQSFDLNNDSSNIGLQEQVTTERNHSRQEAGRTGKDEQQGWICPTEISRRRLLGGDDSVDNENESSSSESETEKSQDSEKDDERRKKRGHHTGPFPHTFISQPGDRRIRFCFGLQTIVTKIRALISRTGSKADFRAEFESHVFTLENVDKMIKFSNRSQKSKKLEATILSNPSDGGLDDDHRYAATMLTQSKSSSLVRDHQYNEMRTHSSGGRKHEKVIQKSYIRTRYARERWLRKCATTIYSKMQRLVNRTGAKMTLRIEYENLVVTPMNYKELEHLLGKYRPASKKFNTKMMVEKLVNEEPSSCSPELEKRSELSDFKVLSRPHLGRSLHIELLNNAATSPSRLLQTIVESDHDYDSQSASLRSSPRLDYPLLSPFNPAREAIPEENSEDFQAFAFGDNDDGVGAYARSMSSSSSIVSAPAAESIKSVDAATNTEPMCQVCTKSDTTGPGFTQWIRCANALCHYLVHPSCIGFFVTSPQSLQYLPLYFCPDHRNIGA